MKSETFPARLSRMILACTVTLAAILTGLLAGAGLPCLADDKQPPKEGEDKKEKGIELTWHGHSCFTIAAPDGTKVVTDPFPPSVGYRLPDLEGQILLVSHDHFDHNSVGAIRGDPAILKAKDGIGKRTIKGITVVGVDSHHYDKEADKERGYNTIFSFEIAGVRFCHLGDLGRKLTDKQKSEIGKVDVLMIPVGGKFTLDKGLVDTVISQLTPRIVVPMHYKTSVMKDEDWPIATVDEFLKGKKADAVVRVEGNTVSISKEGLPKRQEIWVLDFKPKEKK